MWTTFLKQSDEQLVSLLKEVGMKHKSILAFMSYVHGLKAGLEKPAGSSDIAAATRVTSSYKGHFFDQC